MTPELDAAATGLMAELARRRFGLGHVLTARPFAAPFGRLPANHTYSLALKLEAGFDMVRLIYANDQADPIEITTASVAAATAVAPGAAPLDTQGNLAPWTRLTFNNTPGAPLVIPGSPEPGIPVFAGSDWAHLPSLPPAEADGRPWLLTRSFVAREARCILIGPDDFTAFAAPDQCMGRPIQALHQSGDHVSAPAPMTNGHPYGFIAPAAIQYRSRAAGLNLVCVGDSVTCGSGTSSHFSGWGLRASAALSRPDRPVSYVNAGWSGAPSASFLAAARNFLPEIASGHLLLAPFSINDRHTEPTAPAGVESAARAALAVAQDAALHGLRPGFTTPLPWSGAGPAIDALRRALIDTMRRHALPLADMDRALSDGATPARLRPADHADGMHPNEAGNDLMAETVLALLRQSWPGFASA